MRPDLLDTTADAHLLERFQDGGMNILFCGRWGQATSEAGALLEGFDHYRRCYNPRARLLIVLPSGNQRGLPGEIRSMVSRQHLRRHVFFEVGAGAEQLKAFYLVSHAFLCVSSAEEIRAWLLQAIRFEVPIVAWASAPVRQILGNGLLSWESPSPGLLAASLHYCLANRPVGRWLVFQQLQRLIRSCPGPGIKSLGQEKGWT